MHGCVEFCTLESLHACGSCIPRIKDLILMMCSWHSIKRTETRGVKVVSTKTSRDVVMVPPIKYLHEKTTGGKSIGARRGVPRHSNNPGQHSSASRHIGYILHHQSLHLATFVLSQYDTPPLRDVNEVRQASTNYI